MDTATRNKRFNRESKCTKKTPVKNLKGWPDRTSQRPIYCIEKILVLSTWWPNLPVQSEVKVIPTSILRKRIDGTNVHQIWLHGTEQNIWEPKNNQWRFKHLWQPGCHRHHRHVHEKLCMPFEGCPLYFNFMKRIVSKKGKFLQIFPMHLRGRVELVRVIVVCIFFDRLPANALLKTLRQSHRSSNSDIQLVEFTRITHTLLGKQSLKAEKSKISKESLPGFQKFPGDTGETEKCKRHAKWNRCTQLGNQRRLVVSSRFVV